MKTVLVLYGGRSGEHEVSLVSAASVARAIDSRWTVLLAGIDKEGVWYFQPEEELLRIKKDAGSPLRVIKDSGEILGLIPGRGIARKGELLAVDVVFPVLHGSFGEDGLLQGLLENARLAYAGSGVLGSALCMDKDKVKQIWRESGLPVVSSFTLRKTQDAAGCVAAAEKDMGYPLFVKPSRTGSSVGITKAHSRAELEAALREAFRFDTKVLIEKAINAREIECSVVGNHAPRAFTPGEIIPSHEFYDYAAKYTDPQGARLLIPADLDSAVLEEIKRLAVRAYAAAEAAGLARVDFFVEKGTGNIFINEINTIPGFTPISMFPRLCAHDGLSYPDLINELLELGISRFRETEELVFSYTP
ncbi:MAG: D-alanine--D-alanine ligase [Spirochaetales bacterium]|jgi:D-alanine-D-alanine ligase|nr:D-alanine--D-alanine ligase [Spirochaetales bacterium]